MVEVTTMKINWYKKNFGVGPFGAIVSITILSILLNGTNYDLPRYKILNFYPLIINLISLLLVIIGVGLHIWSFISLKNWWKKNKLCTKGAFKYFRHPMYSAWVIFIALGITIYINSWIIFFWYLFLLFLWNKLVLYEEKMMISEFGDFYLSYLKKTNRFFPKIFDLFNNKTK